MYRLLFADDERIIRDGVADRVRWRENGFDLVAALADGRQVLDYVAEHPVDVVLTDISMPRVDGLSVCRELATAHPEVLLLLLTGFDEFEYAQEALRYRVMDLLLKPITAAELEAVLERVRGELDRRRAEDEERRQLTERLEESEPLLRERFLNRLVAGDIGAREVDGRSRFLRWENRGAWYLVGLVYLSPEVDDIDRLAVTDLVRDAVGPDGDVFVNRQENPVILFQGTDGPGLSRRAREIAEDLLRRTSRRISGAVSVALGEEVALVGRIPRSHRGALRALDRLRVTGLPQVLSQADLTERTVLPARDFRDLVRALSSGLRTADGDAAREALEAIFEELERHEVAPEALDVYLARVRFGLMDFVDDMDLGDGDLSALMKGVTPGTLAEARRIFGSSLTTILSALQRRRNAAIAGRLERAKTIVAERYADADLSLPSVCDELSLSVSRFSTLFKDGTGMTFVEFLTAYRVEKARELLLSTDLKAYEIAARVGYPDARYFSHVFKKATGMTSSEFRRAAGS